MGQRHRTSWLAAGLLVCGLTAGTAWAGDAMAKPARNFPPAEMVQSLGLSATQVTQLKAIHEKYANKKDAEHQQMRDRKNALQAALQADTSDAELKRLFAAMQDERRVKAEARFAKMLEIRAILTPDQRKQFQGLRGNWHQNDHHRAKKSAAPHQ